MEIQRLEFTRDWTKAEDFPTIETDETKVRSDMQALYNEIRDYLNDVLSPEVVAEFEQFVTDYATKDELETVADSLAQLSQDAARKTEVADTYATKESLEAVSEDLSTFKTVAATKDGVADVYATKEELNQVVVGVSPDLAATEAVLAAL